MKMICCSIIVLIQVTMAFSFLCDTPVSDIICPDSSEVKYNLYTQNSNTYTEIFAGNLAGITYNSGCPFIFITHGYTHDAFEPWILDMITEFFKNDCYNIIVVDWSAISSSLNYTTDAINLIYPYPAFRTCCTGEYPGQLMIDLNVELSISFANMYFVGHSLGAHLGGCAGQYVFSQKQQYIGRVTGLDPAGPMFNDIPPNCRLSPDDADLVDVIHTDRLAAGYANPLGYMDFFPNSGAQQPGCPSNTNANVPLFCNHVFSILLYTTSINTPGFKSNKCPSYLLYEAKQCFSNPQSEMGFQAKKTVSGSYYLDTLANSPYVMNGNIKSGSLLG